MNPPASTCVCEGQMAYDRGLNPKPSGDHLCVWVLMVICHFVYQLKRKKIGHVMMEEENKDYSILFLGVYFFHEGLRLYIMLFKIYLNHIEYLFMQLTFRIIQLSLCAMLFIFWSFMKWTRKQLFVNLSYCNWILDKCSLHNRFRLITSC